MDTLEKQSAVISPYNVTVSSTVPNVSHSTVQGSFRQMPSIDPGVPGPSGMRQQFIQVNTPNMSANNQQLCSTSRTGPQVKYVPLRLTAQQPSRYNQLPYSNLTQSQLPTGYVQGQPVALNRPSLPSDHGMHSGQTASAAPRMSAVGSYQQPIHFLPRSSGTHQPHPTQIIRQPGNSNQTYHSIARPAQAGNLLHNVPTQIAQGQRPVVVQGNRPSPPVNQTLAIAGTRGAPVRLNQTPLRDLSHISVHGNSLPLPGRPHVNINVTESGIVLSWDNDPTEAISPTIAEYYHLFASQDNPGPATPTIAWKKIGVVKALPLPMACTLTQFASGNSYHFAIRAVDIYGREGPLSNPCTVTLR